MTRYLFIIFGLINIFSTANAENCNHVVSLTWVNKEVKFTTEISNTFELRKQGLQGRKFLAKTASMLFVFDKPHVVNLWMENTHLSLDMMFFDENGFLRTIYKNAIPLSLEIIKGGENIKFALEVNAGIIDRFKIPLRAHLDIFENTLPCID